MLKQAIKNICSCCFYLPLFFLFLTYSQVSFADTDVSGTINSNTTWNLKGSPYIVIGHVTVNSGVTLAVDAGVQVRFAGNFNITVNGVLNVQGTAANNVLFTSNQASPAPGNWQHIFIVNAASSINYATIEYANRAVFIGTPPTTGVHPTIQNSTIRNNVTGVYFQPRSGPIITNNTITNNNDGIEAFCNSFTGCSPTINYNSILNNTQFNLNGTGGGTAFTVNAEFNWWGTIDRVQIKSKIHDYDYQDQHNQVHVDIDPYLDGPNGNPIYPDGNISITTNSVTNRFFDPRNSQTANILYTLDRASLHTSVKIYNFPSQTLVRTLVDDQPRAIGPHSEVFDGRNDAGQFLTEGIYIYKITASDPYSGSGSYDPAFTPGFGPVIYNATLTPNTDFSAYKGGQLQISYDLSTAGLVSFSFAGTSNFIVRQPREQGQNTDYWNGRDSSGKIVDSINPSEMLSTTENLPENFIVIQNGTVIDISLVQSNPYAIRPLYQETTQISYAINASATVTVHILSRDGTQVLKTLELEASKNAGTYYLTWDGKTDAGETIAEEDDYRIRVQAVSAGGSISIRDGNIRVLD